MNDKSSRNQVRRRYDRLAPIYNALEFPMEHLTLSSWRQQIIKHLPASGLILEAGVGTGKNLPYYPPGLEIMAVDLSPRMLQRSRHQSCASSVYPAVMDVEKLAFRDQTFDAIVATFLFCSVADPVQGLRELGRVVQSGRAILLLEHVRPGNPLLGKVFDILNPLTVRLIGPNINRDTVENIRRAGLSIEQEYNLTSDIVKLLVCKTKNE